MLQGCISTVSEAPVDALTANQSDRSGPPLIQPLEMVPWNVPGPVPSIESTVSESGPHSKAWATVLEPNNHHDGDDKTSVAQRMILYLLMDEKIQKAFAAPMAC